MTEITEYGDIMPNAYMDEWGKRRIDGLLEDGVKILITTFVPAIKTWSASLKTTHAFSRPFRSAKFSNILQTSCTFKASKLLKFIQASRTLHAWTVIYPGLILKQWIASLNLTHTFKRPLRAIRFTHALQTLHAYTLKRLFKLTQTLSLSSIFKRPFRRISYTHKLQPIHVFGRPTRFMRLIQQLTLGHAYFVTVPGVKKTKLYLVIGDLAIQLSGG